VTKDRLPVFRTDKIKLLTCAALNEARQSGKFALYAYVIMPDHLHVITDSILPPSKTLQFINGITSRRIIDYLEGAKLRKFAGQAAARDQAPALWSFALGSSSECQITLE